MKKTILITLLSLAFSHFCFALSSLAGLELSDEIPKQKIDIDGELAEEIYNSMSDVKVRYELQDEFVISIKQSHTISCLQAKSTIISLNGSSQNTTNYECTMAVNSMGKLSKSFYDEQDVNLAIIRTCQPIPSPIAVYDPKAEQCRVNLRKKCDKSFRSIENIMRCVRGLSTTF